VLLGLYITGRSELSSRTQLLSCIAGALTGSSAIALASALQHLRHLREEERSEIRRLALESVKRRESSENAAIQSVLDDAKLDRLLTRLHFEIEGRGGIPLFLEDTLWAGLFLAVVALAACLGREVALSTSDLTVIRPDNLVGPCVCVAVSGLVTSEDMARTFSSFLFVPTRGRLEERVEETAQSIKVLTSANYPHSTPEERITLGQFVHDFYTDDKLKELLQVSAKGRRSSEWPLLLFQPITSAHEKSWYLKNVAKALSEPLPLPARNE
jgi:hypothetical protein